MVGTTEYHEPVLVFTEFLGQLVKTNPRHLRQLSISMLLAPLSCSAETASYLSSISFEELCLPVWSLPSTTNWRLQARRLALGPIVLNNNKELLTATAAAVMDTFNTASNDFICI